MLNMRYSLSYLRHLNWYLGDAGQMPLCSDLDRDLPLPDLKHLRVLWPNRYSWSRAELRLEPIKRELSRWIPVELYDVALRDFDWHRKGGFPVPAENLSLIGKPHNPKGPYDIRGEIFEVHHGDRVIRCAYDYSDYPVISAAVLDQVDVYFKKCVPPDGPIPPKVVSIGFYAKNPKLLAKARKKLLKNHPEKEFDVYGRFGSWTDSQPFRQTIVNHLRNSSLDFVGGFSVRIYPAYLRELMRSKIALDAPGQAPASPRLLEAMALGALVVSAKPACVFPEKMIDGVHYVATKDDGSNVVEICHELLEDNERRQRIVDQAMVFFDHNFSPQSMARRILREAIGTVA